MKTLLTITALTIAILATLAFTSCQSQTNQSPLLLSQTNVITSTTWQATSGTACGKGYVGFYRFQKTIAQGWGYTTNTRPYIVVWTNGVMLSIAGKFGDTATACTSPYTIPTNWPDPAFRFGLYFTNPVPASASLTIIGLNP